MPCLAHQPYGFESVEDFRDAFASANAYAIARMASGAAVDGTGPVGVVLGFVARNSRAGYVCNVARINALVHPRPRSSGGRRKPLPAVRYFALRGAGGVGHARVAQRKGEE